MVYKTTGGKGKKQRARKAPGKPTVSRKPRKSKSTRTAPMKKQQKKKAPKPTAPRHHGK